MPRKKMTTEEREKQAKEKLVSEENIIQLSKLTKEDIDGIIDKLYDAVVVHARIHDEKYGYSTIIPGRELMSFTPEENIAIYYYEHHMGEAGRKKVESIVSLAIDPFLRKLAQDTLYKRGGKYVETVNAGTEQENSFAKPDIVDVLVQDVIVNLLESMRYKYNPFNEKAYSSLWTYSNYSFDYWITKSLGEDDQTSYKDNATLGYIKRIEEYFLEKGLNNPRTIDYVYAAEALGINGITESIVDRLKNKNRAVDKNEKYEEIPDNAYTEGMAIDNIIKNERDKMINTILDQIGEYDKFAKMALIAFMEYTPEQKIINRSKYEGEEIKGKMKYVKEYFVNHFYPEEKYGRISINTFTRLLEIAKEEFAYRSKQMGFFKRDAIDGDIYGLNLDDNEYIQGYIANIGQSIQEYNDDDKEYAFYKKYDPRYS